MSFPSRGSPDIEKRQRGKPPALLGPARARLGAPAIISRPSRRVNPVLKYRYVDTYFVRSSNGTIGPVKDHRIRLTDEDIALIQSSLRARAAMTTGLRKHRVERLVERLGQGTRGNPKLIFDEPSQTHEDELDADELD